MLYEIPTVLALDGEAVLNEVPARVGLLRS